MELEEYWTAARHFARAIEVRLKLTDRATREQLRLYRLETLMGLVTGVSGRPTVKDLDLREAMERERAARAREELERILRESADDEERLIGESKIEEFFATQRSLAEERKAFEEAWHRRQHEHNTERDTLTRDILLVALLPELDSRYRRMFGYLVDDASLRQPTVELLLEILHPEAAGQRGRAAFEINAPLVHNHLVVLGGEARGDDGLSMRSVRVDDRIAAYLLGEDGFDSRLDSVIAPPEFEEDSGPLEYGEETAERVEELAEWWQELREDRDQGGVILLYGPYGSGRWRAARQISFGTHLLRISLSRLLLLSQPWELLVDLCYREAALRGMGLVWEGCEILLERAEAAERHETTESAAGPARWDYLVASAERYAGLTILISTRSWDPMGRFNNRHFVSLGFTIPDYALRQELWEYYLRHERLSNTIPDRHELILTLANDFQLTGGQIRDVLSTARGLVLLHRDEDEGITALDLYESARRQSNRQLMAYAHTIHPRPGLTFDSLILPPSNKKQLEELADRMKYRGKVYYDLGFERHLSLGKGLVALFTGTSGTGKTLAAEILAEKSGVNLYKVDLSAVVSKWIGETEQRLNRVFEEAERSNGVLFFDEADALFGKRGEVKEAQDRWANMEVNYLLQRVEQFAGTVLMASNLKNNIDEAFLRRIMYVIDFPAPDEDARVEIYKVSFPSKVVIPVDTLPRQAHLFRINGGAIRNIALESTFRAVAENSRTEDGLSTLVTERHMVLATAREFQKLGMAITRGVFQEPYYTWVSEEILMEPERQVGLA
jgi:hypothetical protein